MDRAPALTPSTRHRGQGSRAAYGPAGRVLLVLFMLVIGATPTPPSELPSAGRCLADACGALTPQTLAGSRRLDQARTAALPQLAPLLLPLAAVRLPVPPPAPPRPWAPPPPSPRLSQGPPVLA